jgi:hypothetical protein
LPTRTRTSARALGWTATTKLCRPPTAIFVLRLEVAGRRRSSIRRIRTVQGPRMAFGHLPVTI